MIIAKYINDVGYKSKKIGKRDSNTDDMVDKQFYFVDSVIAFDEELNTFDDTVFNVIENYQLFLKDYDAVKFTAKLKAIYTAACADDVLILEDDGITVTVLRQEQGFLVDLAFIIKGV